MSEAPRGLYPSASAFFIGSKTNIRYKTTGEYRPPQAGEHYFSGAIIVAYQAPNGLSTSHWIAKPVQTVTCPCCYGTGKTEQDK